MQIKKYNVDIELMVKETVAFEIYAPDVDTAREIGHAMLDEERKKESYVKIYDTRVEEQK